MEAMRDARAMEDTVGGRSLMATEPITIEVDAAAARVFNDASPEGRRVLGVLVSLQLLEAAASHQDPRESLCELMDVVGERAQERGLTEERLREILRESEEAQAEEAQAEEAQGGNLAP
jgi:hypothetical protein